MSSLGFMERLLDEIDVEQKTLGWIGEVRMCKRIMKNQTSDIGDIAFFKIGTFGKKPNAYISREVFDEYKEKYSYPRIGEILISASGTIGRTVVFDGKEAYFQDSNIVWLENNESKVLNKYLLHFYKIAKWHVSNGGVISRLYNDNIKKTSIPIPCPENPKISLEIQAEIVRILDTFTELTTELTTELNARKKQYNYYRDQLLSFEEGEVEWKTLGDTDFFEVASGGTPSKSKPEYWDSGNIPWLKSESCNNEPVYSANNYITDLGLAKSSAKMLQEKTTLIALVGATIFKTAFLEFSATTNQNIASIKSKNPAFVNDKFVFYYITNLYEVLKSEMRNYGMLNLTTLRQFKIPIPSPEEQARIVSILDKFDALTNSITEGLPREIEQRQKQYEYYRDLLLSFPKPDTEAVA